MRKYARVRYALLYYMGTALRALKLTVPLMGTARSGAMKWKCKTDRQTGRQTGVRGPQGAENQPRKVRGKSELGDLRDNSLTYCPISRIQLVLAACPIFRECSFYVWPARGITFATNAKNSVVMSCNYT